MKFTVLLLTLVLKCEATGFTTLLGHQADPCNTLLDSDHPGDCSSVPESRSTVLLPSETSSNALVEQILSGTYSVDMQGDSFNTTAQYNVGLSFAGGSCNTVDADIGFSNVSDVTGSAMTFLIPAAWISVQLEMELAPRRLCIAQNNSQQYWFTGFYYRAVWDCNAQNDLLCPADSTNPAYAIFSKSELQQLKLRTTCCRSGIGLKIGQCIYSTQLNGSPSVCCGGANMDPSNSQCCSPSQDLTAYLNASCPCQVDGEQCPAGNRCCSQSGAGECYDGSTYQCCQADGMRYRIGMQQCCRNGTTSADVACLCASDAECPSGQQCCLSCSSFAGTTTCTGLCMDPTWQICCSGTPCAKAFEGCCGSVCCNSVTSICTRGHASGHVASIAYNFTFYQPVCSSVEATNFLILSWAFVYPAMFTGVSLLAMALAIVFANRASSRSYATLEQIIIGLAFAAIMLSLPLYFSPAYKYAVVMLVTQVTAITSASARLLTLNVVAVILNFVLLLYLVDPFAGNVWLNLGMGRLPSGLPDPETSGILLVLRKMYYSVSEGFCSSWYLGYFHLDPLTLDYWTLDNPAEQNFGYCERSYIAPLLVIGVILISIVVVQFLMVLLALLLRFATPLIEYEIRGEMDNNSAFQPEDIRTQQLVGTIR